jgi:tetratricopeptide (TPR) repeat protein
LAYAESISELGREDEAEQQYRECLYIRRMYVATGGFELVQAIGAMASCLFRQERFEEAQQLFEEGWLLAISTLPEDHHVRLTLATTMLPFSAKSQDRMMLRKCNRK